MEHRFSPAFYRSIAAGSLQSAEAIVPLVNRLLQARSVVDFGCGPGAWLRAFRANGAASVHGLDQFDPAGVELLIDPAEYERVDLSKDVQLPRQYELAVSLEVGEHLPPQASRTLVRNLTRASNRVLFSAATPGQGGVNHVNERPLKDWVAMFAEHGFLASDFIRAAIARQMLGVEPWYRYNMLFFFRESGASGLPSPVMEHLVREPGELARYVPLSWRLRSAVLSLLPVPATTFLANCKHSMKTFLRN